MSVWYTEERIRLQHEIGQRRMARYERRMARVHRQERQERILGTFKRVLGYLLGVALFAAYLFAGCLWASV